MSRDNPRGEMPFLDHLEELRWRIFKAGGSVIAGALLGFFLVHFFRVTALLVAPIRPYLLNGRLHAFSPLTPFMLELKLALIVGLVLAFPIVVYQIWAFLSPALEPQEKKIIIPALYMGMVLFAVGVAFAYLILPYSLKFLFQFQQDYLQPTIGADEYLAFVIRMFVAFGIIFELPVVVMILSAMGLVTPAFLREKRRHAIVIITVVASFLSPGDVIMVTLLMMVPLILLYESSILLSMMIHRRRREREARAEEEERQRILAREAPPEGAVAMGEEAPDEEGTPDEEGAPDERGGHAGGEEG